MKKNYLSRNLEDLQKLKKSRQKLLELDKPVLPPNDKGQFLKKLRTLYDYSTAINAKVEPFPSEPVIMAFQN